MIGRDIVELAMQNLVIIGPALLILSAICCADQLIDFALRLVGRTSKEYRV